MKHLLKGAFPLVAAIVFASCGNSDNNASDHVHENNTAEQANSAANPVLKNDKLNAVYAHYNHLTAALTNSDAGEAKSAAAELEASAEEMENGATLTASTEKITGTEDLEVQRKAYQEISNEMISLIKKEGLVSGEVYVEHCPMAFNNTGGDWLSNTKEIRNPYFGEKMMTCGEVTETIK